MSSGKISMSIENKIRVITNCLAKGIPIEIKTDSGYRKIVTSVSGKIGWSVVVDEIEKVMIDDTISYNWLVEMANQMSDDDIAVMTCNLTLNSSKV
jgi:hypothetical protein